jgi:Transcription antiterminator
MGEYKWYALQVEAGKEATAKENLLKVLALEGLSHKVEEVIVPAEEKVVIKLWERKNTGSPCVATTET